MADKKRIDSTVSMENTCDRKVCGPGKLATFVSSSGTSFDHNECQGLGTDGPSDLGGHKKKTTSFQITSVTVQGSRMVDTGDCGDDSADDLDESHTEDLSSELIDCSKNTDLDNDQLSEDNNSNANVDELPILSPPITVHPNTHPEIGVGLPLGINVPNEFPSVGIGPSVVSSGVTLVTTSTTQGVNTQMPMVNPLPEHWQHRFKVVKLVSSEPFKRGRWLCMDFTDPPPVQPEAKLETTEQGGGSNASSAGSSGGMAPPDTSVGNTLAHVYEIPISQSYPGGISVTAGSQQPLYGLILPMHVGAIPGPQVAMMQPIAFQTAQMPPETSQQQAPQHVFPPAPQPQQAVQPQPMKQTAAAPAQQVVPPSLPSTHLPSSAVAPPPCSQAELSTTTQTSHPTPSVPVSQPIPDAGQSSTTTTIPPPPSQQTLPNPESAFKGASQATGGVELKISGLNPVSAELMAEVVSTHLKSTLDSEESESSSGGSSSTVAIDNKIEQAMDLVKSHLMFAVREEVDVLKERITELMDRISQLEHENGVLRANASPETLSMLSQSTHLNAQPQQQQQPNQPPSQSSQLSQSAAPPPPITVPPQQQQLPPHIQPALLNAQSQTMQIPSQQQLSA